MRICVLLYEEEHAESESKDNFVRLVLPSILLWAPCCPLLGTVWLAH